MKASKSSDAQKAFILKQGADGLPVAEICRKAGISEATYFDWKKRYDGLLPTEMKRRKLLEEENAKLRKLVADLSLDREMPQDVIRRACRVLEVDTSTYHHKSRQLDQAGLEARIKDICATRVRYGYRRVHVLLRRGSWAVKTKRIYRLYKGLGLQLRAKAPRCRVKAKLREDHQVATQPNETWAMDFVQDQLATGRKIRVLTVVDTFSRFSPIVDPRFSYRGEDVVAMLEATCSVVGYPLAIRVDQGSEFVSRDLDLWAYANNVTLDFSRPGKPTDNAVYRGVQRAVPGGVSERALVHDACRRAGKVGGLAQILRQGAPAWGDRR